MQRAHARADVVPCGSSGAASRPEASAASAMEHDDHERPSRGIKLPDFPGEQGQLRSHDGRIWKQSAITILAPFGLVITAMTGVPPRVAEIIDTDIDVHSGVPAGTSGIRIEYPEAHEGRKGESDQRTTADADRP